MARIRNHMEWSADLRAGLIPRRASVERRRRVEQPRERLRVITLSERAHTLATYAKATLSTLEHKVTFSELLDFLLGKAENEIKPLPASTVKAIDDFLSWDGKTFELAAPKKATPPGKVAKEGT